MILATGDGRKQDHRPLGRTVQLLSSAHEMGKMERIVTGR